MVNAGKVVIPHSFMHVIYQSTIAILLLVGFESITALGAEAKRPDKDIKRGVLLSLIIQGGICYLVEYFAANFAVGGATISSGTGSAKATGYAAAATDPAPIGSMLKTVGDSSLGNTGTTISLVVAITVLLALIGTTLACLNTGVRVTYSMAKDKEMPGLLSLLHGRFATPHGAIWVLGGVTAAIGVYCASPYQVDNITQVTLASNTGTFLVYGLTCVVAVVAFASRHDKHPIKHYLVPSLGALMNLAELFGVIYLAIKAGGAAQDDATKALIVVGLWIAAGVVWFAWNSRKQGVKLVDDAPQREPSVLPAIEPEPV
jgi:amino acid transporter